MAAVDTPKVWATLLTNTKYLPGLLALNFSLRSVGSRYPLIVLYTDSLEPEGREALKLRNIPTKRVEYLLPSVHKDYGNDVRFYDCWTKLQPFSLVEYERVIILDSDMIVRKNMDELMDLALDIKGDRVFAASHACVCNPSQKAHYPKDWIPSNCAYTSQNSTPKKNLEIGAPSAFGLGMCNGGLLVIQPSQELYDQIIKVLNSPDVIANYDFADQSLLSDTFHGRWAPLGYIYNALKTMRSCHPEIWDDDEVKNVHYILSPKPWENRESEYFTHKWWWECNDARVAKEKEVGISDGW
ncbi:Glycosyltransferase Family 8 protein [Tuber magnatum]|uniref:Glycosyltransferase Family 8 protein n=1 Tax=Tuber magnatum TaxID=42249 RepID=A0A317SXT8_9PEZI|nr:Glycosyltransferase Family 8 protein [Tuber magnatum]